jgi:endonuclease V-like protein UPF0215 family
MSLYPSIFFDEKNDCTLSKARISEMLTKKREMEKTLAHFKKIEKRWTRADSIIKISGICLATATGIVATVLTSGAVIPYASMILIPQSAAIAGAALAGSSAIKILLTEMITIGWTSR